MSRGKKKRRLLQENPYCIYCGGSEPSTTWDHMPNRGMFPRDRPGGMEFPSCEACNQGSKWFEDIASLIGSIRFDENEAINDHFEEKLIHLQRNHPEAFEELRPSSRQLRKAGAFTLGSDNEPAGALNLSGKIISNALLSYGAKLAIALHWNETKEILLEEQVIGVLYFSNEQLFENSVPKHLFKILPNVKELRQGRKKSSHPFQFASGVANDTGATAHWAFFGEAIIYNLFAGGTLELSYLPDRNKFAPGFLRESRPPQGSTSLGWAVGPILLS